MPSLRTTYYSFDNESLNVKNIIMYLLCLSRQDVIPRFTLDFTDTELSITTIYSAHTTHLPLIGYSIITYNIYTKKWKSIIHLESKTNSVTKTNYMYEIIKWNFNDLIDNNLLKIKYDAPYIDYILESDYIEDIIEPSLNLFYYKTKVDSTKVFGVTMEYALSLYYNVNDIEKFYKKVDKYEKYLLFQSIKKIINNKHLLPEELWDEIYKFF
jgi:hypothetical protein